VKTTGIEWAYQGSVAHFDFRGKIRKPGISNSMTYSHQNSRKSKFATEPDSLPQPNTFSCSKAEGMLATMLKILRIGEWQLLAKKLGMHSTVNLPSRSQIRRLSKGNIL
jgi:hypothetical protein